MSEPLVSEPESRAAPAGPPPPPPAWLKAAGVVVACAAAALVGLVGAFLTPFRIGSVLVPVSLVIVVAGLAAIIRFGYAVTGHIGLSLLPGVVWLVVSLVLSSRTNEGDLVLTNRNWVASAYLLAGSVTVGAVGYLLILRRPRRRR